MGNNAKDLLLAAKARDLLIYTRKKTKPVNSDVDARDVAKLLRRIAELDDLGYHTYLIETGAVVQKLRKTSIQRIRKRIKRWLHDYAEGKITAEKIKSSFLAWDAHAAFGDTYALRQKYAKEVGEIIGEPIRIHKKINSTRIQREKRREKQYRCIEAKRRRQFAMQAGYSRPGVPPWNE